MASSSFLKEEDCTEKWNEWKQLWKWSYLPPSFGIVTSFGRDVNAYEVISNVVHDVCVAFILWLISNVVSGNVGFCFMSIKRDANTKKEFQWKTNSLMAMSVGMYEM